jgi:hypothetical protein
MSGIIAQNTLDNSGLIKSPAPGASWTFIKKLTASGSATLSFVNGASDVVLDATYKEYLFTWNNIHPATNATHFMFNGSHDAGSNYNVTKTSSAFGAYNNETATATALLDRTGEDLAQSTDFQKIHWDNGFSNVADQSGSGYLKFSDIANTTHVKHYQGEGTIYGNGDYCITMYLSGYINSASAVDAFQFKFSSGNIDLGDICLYGISI